jgi:Lipopolysaccharide kinase (Kdo/WaaP) family
LEFSRFRKDLWGTQNGPIDYINLFFDATLGGVDVLAKVVTRPYGVEVHAYLAARHMAPQLYGTSNVHGIASVVAMEYLSRREGWVTLFDYRANEYARGHLLKRLEAILDYLGAAGMVHGDFRMANIMLKPGKEEEAVLVDFDWAGEAGKVRYPVTRSNGLGYPGQAGGFIGVEDDRRFYETWKDKI